MARKCAICQQHYYSDAYPSKVPDTCSPECKEILRKRHAHSADKSTTRECTRCGTVFTAQADAMGRRSRRRTCSDECRERAMTREPRPERKCPFCGGLKSTAATKTCCKPECRNKWRNLGGEDRARYLHQYAVCRYSAPNAHDFENMLDIMSRKGYTEGNETEAYQYRITEEGDILFIDLEPRDPTSEAIIHRASRAGKEQQEHRTGVEQEAKAKGAHQSPLEKLLQRIEGGLASTQGPVEREGSSWVH